MDDGEVTPSVAADVVLITTEEDMLQCCADFVD